MKQLHSKIGYNPNIFLEYHISEKSFSKSIKQYLNTNLDFSTELIKRAKYRGQILLNNRPAKVNELLHYDDVIKIHIPEYRHAPCKPYSIELDVVFEDENVLIINKPAPLPCLCGPNDMGNTLQNAVYSYFNMPEKFLFRPLNRLDCGTSGLMLIAKNAYAQSVLQNKLHTDEFKREYIAIVENFALKDQGIIDLPIARKSNTTYMVSANGKPCKTEYKVIERIDNLAMLSIRLHSGRTHQIRVHFSHLGSPIVGDYIYGQISSMLKDRFALHSFSMDVKLPNYDNILHFDSEVPDEIMKIFHK